MKNAITHLKIENFKSIKSIEMDCKRINIFLGKPNVGKSNILEAISLISAIDYVNIEDGFSKLIRFESIENIFYDNDIRNTIKIKTNFGQLSIYRDGNRMMLSHLFGNDSFKNENASWDITSEEAFKHYLMTHKETKNAIQPYIGLIEGGNIKLPDFIDPFFDVPIKKYEFDKKNDMDFPFEGSLNVPYGDNLAKVISSIPELRNDISLFLEEYGLQPVYRINHKTNGVEFEIQKNVNGFIYSYPYPLMADTLRRIIFHLAAIYSNQDSVLLFEEPEAHMFPPYVIYLADKILESKDNQFFIATHSDHFLTEVLQSGNLDEIAIFKVYYENYETKVHPFSKDEIGSILDYGYDPFINHRAFGNDEQKES